MPPTPRPGMVNRMWFPNDDEDDEDRVQMTNARPTRQRTVPLPNRERGLNKARHTLRTTPSYIATSNNLAIYYPPNSGFLAYLPNAWVPFAELIRLNEPAGMIYFYYPFLFGTLLAACLLKTTISPTTLFGTNLVLFAAAFMARSAACAWSDVMNASYDYQVSRCRLRPIVRGAITPAAGVVYAAIFFAIWLGIIFQLPGLHLRQLVSYVFFHSAYPVIKRYTYYAPLCRGFTLATGVMIGSSVLGVDIIALSAAGGSYDAVNNTIAAVLCLWLASAMWTVIVEVVQEYQGLKDDLQAGMVSFAVASHRYGKLLISLAAMVQLGLLFMTGDYMGAGPMYFAVACGGPAVLLVWMLFSLDLESPGSCSWWYRNGLWVVGECIGEGLVAEYLSRRYGLWGGN